MRLKSPSVKTWSETLQTYFMRKAIEIAKKGIRLGQTPFGACVVLKGKVIALNHNNVWKNTDITAHAEIQAIRSACRKIKTVDLSGAIIYSTCEPCPMCFSAIHWAGIKKIFYGAKISDAKRHGFRELTISNIKMKIYGKSKIQIIAGCMKKECLELFQLWKKNYGHKTY